VLIRSAESPNWNRLAWGAIAVGALIRLLWAFVLHPPYDFVFSDMQGYVSRAQGLATGAPLERYFAFYPPGTHILLAGPLLLDEGVVGLRAAAALWWALSSASVVFAWRLALCLLTPRAAAVTAALCAAYPLFFFYAGFFSSETPAMALLLAGLWLGYRSRHLPGRAAVVSAIGSGMLAGAAVAVRPQFLLNVVVLGVAMRGGARLGRLQLPVALAAAAILVLIPVVVHNSAAANKLTGISEYPGLIFYQAHCDIHLVTAGTPERGVFAFGSPVAFERNRGHDETFPDRQVWDQGFFLDRGLDCIREDGFSHLRIVGRNLLDAGATSTPFPLGDPPAVKTIARATNLVYSLGLVVIVVATIVLLRRRRDRPTEKSNQLGYGERQLLLHLACLLPVVLVFLSEPRYRIPYDVFGLMLLAALVTAGLGSLRRRAPA